MHMHVGYIEKGAADGGGKSCGKSERERADLQFAG